MSALLSMLRDFVPYFIISLVVSPSAYFVEEKYRIKTLGLIRVALGSAAGYRIFSYIPQLAVIAYIAAAYAFSGSAMPRSSANVRMIYSITLATLFSILFYFLQLMLR